MVRKALDFCSSERDQASLLRNVLDAAAGLPTFIPGIRCIPIYPSCMHVLCVQEADWMQLWFLSSQPLQALQAQRYGLMPQYLCRPLPRKRHTGTWPPKRPKSRLTRLRWQRHPLHPCGFTFVVCSARPETG